jgi:D-beta-D-heptose 7-phosphate kinase/D-beta-D-heptose 1-phosphate adenosyltransferase
VLTTQAQAALEQTQVLVLSDYGKGSLADTSGLISAARARGIPVVVDPKGTDFEKYRGATVITPNLSEFEAVAGHCA